MTKVIIVAISLIFGFLIANLYFFDGTQLTKFEDEASGAVLSYSPKLAENKVDESDVADKIFFRQSIVQEEYSALITARWEDGLKIVATTTKQDLVDVLSDSIEKTFPTRYPEFKLISKRVFTYNTRDAVEAIFTYRGPEGFMIQQRFLGLVRDDDSAVYLQAQAPTDSFDGAEKEIFDDVFTSFTIQNQ